MSDGNVIDARDRFGGPMPAPASAEAVEGDETIEDQLDDMWAAFFGRTNPSIDRAVDLFGLMNQARDSLVKSHGFEPVQAEVAIEAAANRVLAQLHEEGITDTQQAFDYVQTEQLMSRLIPNTEIDN